MSPRAAMGPQEGAPEERRGGLGVLGLNHKESTLQNEDHSAEQPGLLKSVRGVKENSRGGVLRRD